MVAPGQPKHAAILIKKEKKKVFLLLFFNDTRVTSVQKYRQEKKMIRPVPGGEQRLVHRKH